MMMAMTPSKAKLVLTVGALSLGFIGAIIGVSTSVLVSTQPGVVSTVQRSPPTYGYFGACDSAQAGAPCSSLVSDYYQCSLGTSPSTYSYSGFFTYYSDFGVVDSTACQRVMASEAFGILAIVFSFAAVASAAPQLWQPRQGKRTAAVVACALLASLFGLVALAVFFSTQPASGASGNDWWQEVLNNHFQPGYSFVLQVLGVIFSFLGALASIAVRADNSKADASGEALARMRDRAAGAGAAAPSAWGSSSSVVELQPNPVIAIVRDVDSATARLEQLPRPLHGGKEARESAIYAGDRSVDGGSDMRVVV